MLSLIVPTLNEAENLPRLLPALTRVLSGIDYEIIVADDSSDDGTAEVAEAMAQALGGIRVLRRSSNPGLSESVLDGFRIAKGTILGVMDADMQHDLAALPAMVDALATCTVVVGSRYGHRLGGTQGWSLLRLAQSRLATLFTQRLLGIKAGDPLSGYFVVRRSAFEAIRSCVRPRGWKILLEVLANLDAEEVMEVPYVFSSRQHGKTKMSTSVLVMWLQQVWQLRGERRARLCAGRILPRPVLIGSA